LTEVIQGKLLPEVGSRITGLLRKANGVTANPSSHSVDSSLHGAHHSHRHTSIPSRALRWLCAAETIQTYTKKLSEELQQLAVSHFHHPEALVRFSEQRHDVDLVAKLVEERVREWTTRTAHIVSQNWMQRVSDRFLTTSYAIDEKQFYQFDLADPWALAATQGWGHSLDFIDHHMTHASTRDRLVYEICVKIVKAIEDLVFAKKQYSGFGALQLDKDVRVLRQFFTERTEHPVREVFSRISAIVTLLLIDRPAEANDLFASHVPSTEASATLSTVSFTVDEKRRIVGLRVDFDPQVIVNSVTM